MDSPLTSHLYFATVAPKHLSRIYLLECFQTGYITIWSVDKMCIKMSIITEIFEVFMSSYPQSLELLELDFSMYYKTANRFAQIKGFL